MTDDTSRPINGADHEAVPENQPEPPSDLEVANQRIAKMMAAIQQAIAQAGKVNPASLVANGVLRQQQFHVLLDMLVEKHGLDPHEFNRRLGLACAEVTANLANPQIAIAVGDALRPKR